MWKKVIVLMGIVVALFIVCVDSPTDFSSPENAASNILLVSPTFGTVDTVIIDSVGKEIEIIISYVLGYFIDSVYIDIYSDSLSFKAAEPDSQIIIRFSKDDLRDTMHFPIKFTTEGMRHFIVRTFKRQGFVSISSATATSVTTISKASFSIPISFS